MLPIFQIALRFDFKELAGEDTSFVVFGYPSDIGRRIPQNWTQPLELELVDPSDGCHGVRSSSIKRTGMLTQGRAGVVVRGNCSFVSKARRLEAAGYKAMIMFEDGSDECLYMSGKDEESEGRVGIYAGTITSTAGHIIRDRLTDDLMQGFLSMKQPPTSGIFDLSELVLALLAVGTLWIAGLWIQASIRKAEDGNVEPARPCDRASLFSDEAILTTPAAASFVFVASSVLLVMYFLLNNYLTFALLGLVTVVAIQATNIVFRAFFNAFAPPLMHRIEIKMPAILKRNTIEIHPSTVLSNFLAATIGFSYFLFRDCHWTWILQDFLAVSFMLVALRTLYLPDIKVASILLISAMLYDVWWVFLQPMVTHTASVMVEVATGLNGQGVARLPIVLVVPKFNGLGSNPSLAVLGLGDIVLPGLLCMFCARMDQWRLQQERQSHRAPSQRYFVFVLFAYIVGLSLTYLALAFNIGGSEGQPALLWLVPATLGTTYVLAWWRGEFWELWTSPVETVDEQINSHFDIENDFRDVSSNEDNLEIDDQPLLSNQNG